uniref:Bifunctional inhibitor/plant lipid transfer protein/seed storage helical domain-containing protein n=1 Tax=Picea sitchensis TaxID=3332 RepID=C0PQX9_PICSI|nr:unknown [Picea sitchensis]
MAGITDNKMPSISSMSLPLLLLLLALWAVTDIAVAQAPSGCSSALVSLAPCIGYVTGSAPKPSDRCCSGLTNVVNTNPVCLCQLFSGGNNVGVNVNQTLALAMPAACKVSTPPLSSCKAAGVPVPPISSPPSPKVPSTGSGSGDKTKPTQPGSSPADVSSAGIFAPTAIGLFFIGLFFSAIPL